jgi:hypothetical protein
MQRNIRDGVIKYDDKLDSFSLLVRQDAETLTTQDIFFCPWCASKLPESRRETWLNELEALGIDPMKDEIPETYRSSKWWSKSG